MGCKAEIKLKASSDGNYLIVDRINSEHNHELSKVIHLSI